MIRTKGEAGTGNLVAAVTHARLIDQEIRQIHLAFALVLAMLAYPLKKNPSQPRTLWYDYAAALVAAARGAVPSRGDGRRHLESVIVVVVVHHERARLK